MSTGDRRRRGPTAKRGRRRPVPLAAASILLCAVVAALVAVEHLASAGEIRGGVSVGGVFLGGKTPDEAREILARWDPAKLDQIQLSGLREVFALPADGLDVRLDARTTAERAYAVGRRGGVLERLAERARTPFGVSVPAEVRFPDFLQRADLVIPPQLSRSGRSSYPPATDGRDR